MIGSRSRSTPESGLTSLVPFGAMSLFVLLFGRYWHEPWADEVQAYLIAHTTSWTRLFEVLQLEGVAPLYHLTLRGLSAVLPPLWVLPVVSAAGYLSLLLGVRAVAFLVSGRPTASMALACLFGLTDTFVQELGIVARSYGLGLGLALIASANVFRAATGDAKYLRRASVWVALSMLFSVQGGCVSGGAFVALVLSSRKSVHARTAFRWALLPLVALAIDGFFIRPNVNRTSHQTLFHVPEPSDFVSRAADLIADGIGASGWWPAGWRFDSKAQLVPPVVVGVLGALSYGAFGLLGSRQRAFRTLAAGFAFGMVATLTIQLFFNTGFYRHHLFLVQPWLVLGASALLVPLRAARGARWLFVGCMSPLGIHELRVLQSDLGSDLHGAFVETRALQEKLPHGAHVVVHAQDAVALGVLLGRDDIVYRSSKNHGGAYTRFTLVDRHLFDEADVRDLVQIECALAPDRTYLVVDKGMHFPFRTVASEEVRLERRITAQIQPIEAFRVVCETLQKP